MAFSSLIELERVMRLREIGERLGKPKPAPNILSVTHNPNPLSEVTENTLSPEEIYDNLLIFLKHCSWLTIEGIEEYQFYKKELTYLLRLQITDPKLRAVLREEFILCYLGIDKNDLKDFLSLGWRINEDLINFRRFTENFWVKQQVVFLPGESLLESNATRMAFLVEQIRIIFFKQNKAKSAYPNKYDDQNVDYNTEGLDAFDLWLLRAKHKFKFHGSNLLTSQAIYIARLSEAIKHLPEVFKFLDASTLPNNFFGNSRRHQGRRNDNKNGSGNRNGQNKSKGKSSDGRLKQSNQRGRRSRSF